jgi:hypothetical protein
MAAAVVANGASGDSSKAAFAEIYSRLKEEMLEDPAFEFTDESLQWIDRVMLSSPSRSFMLGGIRMLVFDLV